MKCDRCGATDKVLKDMWTPDNWKLGICAECRVALKNGATFDMPAKPVGRLSRMAKQLRKQDEPQPENLGSIDADSYAKTVAEIQPFPASWRKSK